MTGDHFIAAAFLGPNHSRDKNADLLHAFGHLLHGLVVDDQKRMIREVADLG